MRRHWLLGVNLVVGVFIAGALVAPLLAAAGLTSAADSLYAAYHLTCHQWAFRSFFVLGGQAVYSIEELQQMGLEPFGFVGQHGVGWKMAFCERDFAIYATVLIAGLVFARKRHISGLGVPQYVVLILPMAIDGFTQLFGWRESTWELRVLTGALFGLASVWLIYPRFDASLPAQQYAPDNACAPQAQPPRG
ncbi:MAG TPA: DUF2085 domain-containing protein [Chloroflexota bacterium]|jgi:uncharacterized membrane protein